MASNQHHDTITGTSKNRVAEHYLYRQQAIHRSARVYWRPIVDILVEVYGPQRPWVVGPPEQFVEFWDSFYTGAINSDFKILESESVAKSGFDIRFAAPLNETWSANKELWVKG